MDNKALFWWHEHKLIETAREQNFHGRKHAEIRQEGQGREIQDIPRLFEKLKRGRPIDLPRAGEEVAYTIGEGIMVEVGNTKETLEGGAPATPW